MSLTGQQGKVPVSPCLWPFGSRPTEVELLADPERLAELDLEILDA